MLFWSPDEQFAASCPSAFPSHRPRFGLPGLDSLQKVPHGSWLCSVEDRCVQSDSESSPALLQKEKATEPRRAEAQSFSLTLNVLEQKAFVSLSAQEGKKRTAGRGFGRECRLFPHLIFILNL